MLYSYLVCHAVREKGVVGFERQPESLGHKSHEVLKGPE